MDRRVYLSSIVLRCIDSSFIIICRIHFSCTRIWTPIHQKLNDDIDFNLTWNDYKVGFGDPGSNFWIGLETMHQMTSTAPYRLRIEFQASYNSVWYYAEYSTFLIDAEANQYTIHVSGFTGDGGDSLQYNWTPTVQLNGSTMACPSPTRETGACAQSGYGAGNWFNNCYYFLLTGSGTTVNEWGSLKDVLGLPSYVLSASRMMIQTY